MIISYDNRGNYHSDPLAFLDLHKFNHDRDNTAVKYGIANIPEVRNDNEIYIDFEAPLPIQPNIIEYSKLCKKVLCLCPYTADWVNKINGAGRCESVFFPFNTDHIPKEEKKEWDVCYIGHLVNEPLNRLGELIWGSFRGKIVGYSGGPLTTDRNVSYYDKLKIITKTKISIVHNLCWVNQSFLNRLKTIPHSYDNIIYKEAKVNGLVPQLKSRVFEAAFCKSLILCRRDKWNLIEEWFKPGEHFLYYDINPTRLEDRLDLILDDLIQNYDLYDDMRERAFKHCMENYSCKSFVDKYLNV